MAHHPTISNANFSSLFNTVKKAQSAMDGSSTVTNMLWRYYLLS